MNATTSANPGEQSSEHVSNGQHFQDVDSNAPPSANSLRTELMNLKTELDALLSRAPTLSEGDLHLAYRTLTRKFSMFQNNAKGVVAKTSHQLSKGVDTTAVYVRNKPLQALAVAVGTGLLLGILYGRR